MNILVDGQTLSTPEVNRGIGVYFKNVLSNMVKQRYECKWYILISDRNRLDEMDPWVKKRIVPIIDNVFAPGSDYERGSLFTRKVNEIVKNREIDIFWIPNPLMINVLFPTEPICCRVFATVYDLIPVVMPIKEWSANVRKEYDRRLAYLKANKVFNLFISEATKFDFKKYVDESASGIVTFLAADSKKFYNKKVGERKENIIVFTGGFDYRKNISGALEAFVKMVKRYSDDEIVKNTKLYIVCKYDESSKTKIVSKLKKMGIENQVVFTGYVTDEELASLYAKALVFFFPSLYEGFGLPILEAMLGGAYVLSADNSSLPEVCGDYALMCDATNIEDMALKLYDALYNSLRENDVEKENRKAYALSYSWENTAEETLTAFEKKHEDAQSSNRKRIAIITPWPYQQTGIATFLHKLLPYLSKYFWIDIFVDNIDDKKTSWKEYEYGEIYEINKLDDKYSMYDKLLYQIGNNSKFHTGILNMLLKYPGFVEIHDYILHPFIYHSYFLEKKYDMYKNLLEIGYGEAGVQHCEYVEKHLENPNNDRFPMSHSISKLSKGTIVHNQWSKDHLEGCTNICVIPLPAFDKEVICEEKRILIWSKFDKKIMRQEKDIVIGCFGFVNSNKRPEKIIEAIEQMVKEKYNVKLVFFGKAGDDNVLNLIKKKNLKCQVFITGYLDRDEYEIGLEYCDIIINLRFPSMGESSGTLCESFKHAKPVLVSDINQYQEYPDDVCWKVPVNQYEVPVLVAMLKFLIEHKDVRNALGKNASAYAEYVLAPERIAKLYRQFLERED